MLNEYLRGSWPVRKITKSMNGKLEEFQFNFMHRHCFEILNNFQSGNDKQSSFERSKEHSKYSKSFNSCVNTEDVTFVQKTMTNIFLRAEQLRTNDISFEKCWERILFTGNTVFSKIATLFHFRGSLNENFADNDPCKPKHRKRSE